MCSDDVFIEAAGMIGEQIAADAVWHRGRCAWVGVDPGDLRELRYRALGPDLYGGTAGVGLFLAQLAAVTGEVPLRRTAVGALRHAVARVPAGRDGFHAGPAGIAWAAARAGELLGEEELREGARTAAGAMRTVVDGARSWDVATGAAGAILGRLALDEPDLAESAIADGDALIASAAVDAYGWSWPSADRRHPHHLCGLLHGAAGIGWALLELFTATRDERFRTAAAGAFAYERSWMDTAAGTWPDHRLAGYRRGRAHPFPSPAVGTWCHGEAGIALTRLWATELPSASDDLSAALATTRRWVREAIADGLDDLSLCHGPVGGADVLLSAGVEPALASELGGMAVERLAQLGDRSGMRCGPGTPGLFRGLAGIGWWFLRLRDRRIPSPFALTRLRITA